MDRTVVVVAQQDLRHLGLQVFSSSSELEHEDTGRVDSFSELALRGLQHEHEEPECDVQVSDPVITDDAELWHSEHVQLPLDEPEP